MRLAEKLDWKGLNAAHLEKKWKWLFMNGCE
jgi:hypothetical protein